MLAVVEDCFGFEGADHDKHDAVVIEDLSILKLDDVKDVCHAAAELHRILFQHPY